MSLRSNLALALLLTGLTFSVDANAYRYDTRRPTPEQAMERFRMPSRPSELPGNPHAGRLRVGPNFSFGLGSGAAPHPRSAPGGSPAPGMNGRWSVR